MEFSVSPYRQFLWSGIALLSLAAPAVCQSLQVEAVSAPVVPQTIKYDGVTVQHARETVAITFRIYSTMEGGEPMWSETQRVAIGADGKYSVFLGADTQGGLPQTVFAAGQARWLGISIAGSPEQGRVPVVSVAYAMKAADAETLGGMPATEFVTKAQLGTQAGTSAAAPQAASASGVLVNPAATPSGSGTAGAIAEWTSSTTLGNSAITQGGTSAAPLIGVGTTSPTTLLDVNGATTQRGNFTLSTLTAATATGGVGSPELLFSASSFLSGGSAVKQNFVWQAVPVGNNTATPSASLNLLFASGVTAPAATGLAISPKGVFTFATGQTFPGTVTSVVGSGPITAATSAGVVTVGLNATTLETTLNTVYPRLSAANTFTGNQAVTGNLTASGTVSGGGGNVVSGVTGSTSSTASQASGVVGSSTAATGSVFGVLGAARSTTTGAAGVTGVESASTGQVYGVSGSTSSTTAMAAGVNGIEGATTGQVFGVSGLAYSSTNGAAAVKGHEYASSGPVYGVLGANESSGPGAAGVVGSEHATTGVVYGVIGSTPSTSGIGVSGIASATTGNTNGVSGTSASPNGNGVLGHNVAASGFAVGVTGITNSPGGAGVNGFSLAASGGIGVNGNAPTNGIALQAGNQVCGQNGCTNAAGTAAFLFTGSGGTLISAVSAPAGSSRNTASTQEFSVDASGNGYFAGNLYAGTGVSGSTVNGTGVYGLSSATSGFGNGLMGEAKSPNAVGVRAQNDSTTGGTGSWGVASSSNGIGGLFTNLSGAGLVLAGNAGSGCNGSSGSCKGIFTVDASGNGYYAGNLNITGKLTKGSGSFKIDHPLDPSNKYLSHSFVESPDMMNVYNGNVTTDKHGMATVVLPDYFEALNRDYRYQLTVIGQFAEAIVAREIDNNRFVIRTNKSGVKVSWQVTGIRQDAYANANRIPVEEDKPAEERGLYLHPEVFRQPADKSVAAAARPASTADNLRSGSQ
jgi:hypothetical protein